MRAFLLTAAVAMSEGSAVSLMQMQVDAGGELDVASSGGADFGTSDCTKVWKANKQHEQKASDAQCQQCDTISWWPCNIDNLCLHECEGGGPPPPPSPSSTTTDCSKRCGTSWGAAAEGFACPGGVDGECPAGTQCFRGHGGSSCNLYNDATGGDNGGDSGGSNNDGGGGGGGAIGSNGKCGASAGTCTYDASSGMAQWFSKALFNQMFPHICEAACQATNACEMLTYECLMEAVQSDARFASFANSGNLDNDKRELAAWLGIMGQETTGGGCGNARQDANGDCSCSAWCDSHGKGGCSGWGLCFVQEQGCSHGGCTYGKYYGRGPKQLSWEYNYKEFSEYYCGDASVLLANPDNVATNSKLAWSSSIWFWYTGGAGSSKPGCHDVFVGSQPEELSKGRKHGLGWAINIVNGGLECGASQGKCDARVHSRVRFYKYYCSVLGVADKPVGWTDDDNLYCSKQTSYR